MQPGWGNTLREFVESAYKRLGLKKAPEAREAGEAHERAGGLSGSKAREVAEVTVHWAAATVADATRVEIVGDSLLVVNWLNAFWRTYLDRYRQVVAGVQDTLYKNLACGVLAPRNRTADILRHVYREHNTWADRLANLALDGVDVCSVVQWSVKPVRLRLAFDGAKRKCGRSASAWVLWGAGGDRRWTVVAEVAFCQDPPVTITEAELQACTEGVAAVISMAHGCGIVLDRGNKVVHEASHRWWAH